ncbi:MAG: hypothetical protein Q8N51_17645 [Gammaproteobacteria bacterium]|nr:hypothetical protein [Gammaproteobacteria bacterium]
MRLRVFLVALISALVCASPASAWVQVTPQVTFGAPGVRYDAAVETASIPSGFVGVWSWSAVGFTPATVGSYEASASGNITHTFSGLDEVLAVTSWECTKTGSFALILMGAANAYSPSGGGAWWPISENVPVEPAYAKITGQSGVTAGAAYALFCYLNYGGRLNYRVGEGGANRAPTSLIKSPLVAGLSAAYVLAVRPSGADRQVVTWAKDQTTVPAGENGGRMVIKPYTIAGSALTTGRVGLNLQAAIRLVQDSSGLYGSYATGQGVQETARGLVISAVTTNAAEVDAVFANIATFNPDVASIEATAGYPLPPAPSIPATNLIPPWSEETSAALEGLDTSSLGAMGKRLWSEFSKLVLPIMNAADNLFWPFRVMSEELGE